MPFNNKGVVPEKHLHPSFNYHSSRFVVGGESSLVRIPLYNDIEREMINGPKGSRTPDPRHVKAVSVISKLEDSNNDIITREDSGKIIISGEDNIPDGSSNSSAPGVWRTVSPHELRREKEENQLYDNRYEGRSKGYDEDPDNFSTSGLKV